MINQLKEFYNKIRYWVVGIIDRDPITKYLVIITSIISLTLIVEALVDGPQKTGVFITLADKKFIINFVEWFGVIYGFIWSTIVVKVWEQFEELNSTFDREVDAIQLLVEDLSLLNPKNDELRSTALSILQTYVRNVRKLMRKDIPIEEEEALGNENLSGIRSTLDEMFHPQKSTSKESDVLLGDILTQLNTIVDNRSDRISLLTQSTFDSLKFISMVTSIVWLTPFYFLDYTDYLSETIIHMQMGIFGWFLVIAVTYLVVIIMSIMDDLNTPFDGYWIVDAKSWEKLANRITQAIDPQPAGNSNPKSETK